jgi:hypothetical protein
MLETARKNVEIYQKKLEEFKIEEAQKASQIKQNLSNIKVLKFETFKDLAVGEVKNQLENLKAFTLKIEKDYNQYQLYLNDLNPKLAAQKSSIELLEKRIEFQKTELVQLKNSIQETLIQSKIENIEVVYSILNLKIDDTNT